MIRIEIDDIQELIRKKYPPLMIKKLLNDILILSLRVKEEYPDYKEWYKTKQIPGIYENTRNIIIAHINDRIVGFISLKKTEDEKKICTFYVEKGFRRNQIGSILMNKAVEYLEEEKPLITMPIEKIHEFIRISKKYNWEITDIKENLYRLDSKEIILNGYVKQTENGIILPKKLEKLHKIHKFTQYKEWIKVALFRNNLQKLWK